MNLHGIVRGAITAVNPDIAIMWLASTGPTVAAGGKMTPSYAAPAAITGQVQAASAETLQHADMLNSQDVVREAWLYGNKQGIVRVDAKGGDLLQFAQVPSGPVQTWLVRQVIETWPDWCHVLVTLQLDPNNP